LSIVLRDIATFTSVAADVVGRHPLFLPNPFGPIRDPFIPLRGYFPEMPPLISRLAAQTATTEVDSKVVNSDGLIDSAVLSVTTWQGLLREKSTIDRQYRARDEGRLIGGKKQNRLCHLT
jgi:hypothetical protein